MKLRSRFLFCLMLPLVGVCFAEEPGATGKVHSEILRTEVGERVLIQEITLATSVEAAWKAYTTEEGWTGWASPHAKIDLRVGGTIRTHYDKAANVGDAGTNTLHIVAYVPERLLTLRADLQPNWPKVLQKDADKLSNVILFERLGERTTRVVSYGIGYGDSEEYEALLGFFVKANAGLMEDLRNLVEDGVRSSFE